MKNENEIRSKIDEYMNKLFQDVKEEGDNFNQYYGIIDALLWVIGDESGAAI